MSRRSNSAPRRSPEQPDRGDRHQRRPPCSPAYGRRYCPHPIGESHDSAPLPISPIARSAYATPSTAPVMPYAPGRSRRAVQRRGRPPPNTRPRQAGRQPQRDRAGHRQPVPDQAAGDQAPNAHWPSRRAARRRQRGVPADAAPGAARPAALLLGAGVPPDQEHAHQRRDDRPNAAACHATCPPSVLRPRRDRPSR